MTSGDPLDLDAVIERHKKATHFGQMHMERAENVANALGDIPELVRALRDARQRVQQLESLDEGFPGSMKREGNADEITAYLLETRDRPAQEWDEYRADDSVTRYDVKATMRQRLIGAVNLALEARAALAAAAERENKLLAVLDDFAHAAQAVLDAGSIVGQTEEHIKHYRSRLRALAGKHMRAQSALSPTPTEPPK